MICHGLQFEVSSKGASIRVAPFAFCALLFILLTNNSQADTCPASATSEKVVVEYIYDGDTVKLTDGRRVRLIGINTPEMRPGKPGREPFADEARAALQSMLDRNDRTLLLQYGRERKDHYGRLLAHAFLPSGDNVGARLLADGLATALVVPPNTWGHACYQAQENQARTARRGLWNHKRYQARLARLLPANARGFTIVYAEVVRIRPAGGTLWLELDGPLSVRIARQDRANFPAGFLERLAGQAVEIRGWIGSRGGKLSMKVRHPAALLIIDRQSP